ncbi:MAG: PadR family transcriptional regulator [Bryobacterales bacterium]|nr:PadR family transcriptional regulator [Bryobacterales bacterium]
MQRNRPPSEQTVAVLLSLAQDPSAWRHGYDLCQQTGLKAGTLYPILIRLAERKWLDTMWETGGPTGRPPRHLYRLTEAGLGQAKEIEAARVEAANKSRLGMHPRMGEA